MGTQPGLNVNVSDITLLDDNSGGALVLPIRSEKHIQTYEPGSAYQEDAFFIEQRVLTALLQHDKYVAVRIKGRTSALGVYNPASTVVYQFLINPNSVQISRQTVDEQAQTRAGWQIGVWGEDFITVTLSGKTPGRYFAYGTTDLFAHFTHSYRNLAALEVLFENNGCWFEGEQVTGILASTTRRIKFHQDIELIVGEYIWYGMFESMTVSESASSPFLADFHLGFTAWRETFDPNTPYNMPAPGTSEIQRGHVPPKTMPPVPQVIPPPVPQVAVYGININYQLSGEPITSPSASDVSLPTLAPGTVITGWDNPVNSVLNPAGAGWASSSLNPTPIPPPYVGK